MWIQIHIEYLQYIRYNGITYFKSFLTVYGLFSNICSYMVSFIQYVRKISRKTNIS